jgi:hypothetical protein
MASNPWAADVARIQAAIKQTLANIARDEAALAQNPGNTRLQQQVESGRAYLADLQQQLNTFLIEFNNFAAQPAASSGAIVGNANLARDENASSTLPSPPQQVITPTGRITSAGSGSGTNANPTPTTASDPTEGTNAPVRTAAQTQAINTAINNSGLPVVNEDGTVSNLRRNPETGDLYDPGPNAAPVAGPGAAAGNEDSGQAKNATQTSIDTLFSTVQSITPQGNILDQYSSYTYNISVYLMDKNGFKRLIQSAKRNVAGYALLFQSGGSAANSSGDTAATAGRNPYFSLDYYIDNVEISGLVSGKGTGAPHNSTNMKFTVIEPNGITLVNNLNDAVLDYIYNGNINRKKSGGGGQAPWGGQNYLMVIKFYGYDSSGNLVRGGVQKPDGGSDPNAVIEKYIPFQISELKFKVGSKMVEYNFECVTPGNAINASANRGTIPYDLEIAASTLKEALAGQLVVTANAADANGRPAVTPANQQASVRAIDNAIISTTSGTSSNGVGVLTQEQLAAAQQAPGSGSGYYTPPANPNSQTAPGKANTAPKKNLTVNKGLFAALNKWQQDLVADGTQSLADIYEVEFASDALANALVTYRGGIDPSNSSMPKGGSAADQLNPNKQSADFSTNTLRAKAGMQIVQFLDQMARNSTYIQDQQTVVIDPTDGTQKPQGKGGQNLAWFQIGFGYEPIDWDEKRKDYAYKIKYVLTPYWVATVDSAYFPTTAFRGVHKNYPYWFTGQNTAIINYEQTYNTLYTRILSGAPATDTRTSDLGELNDLVKKKFSPRSGQSSQGAQGRTNEPAANAADKLYSPEDLAHADVRIIGDPAWIFQGDVSYGASAKRYKPDPFFADGTINSESRQVYFEVNFNLPGDYNLNTGLMEPGTTGTGRV